MVEVPTKHHPTEQIEKPTELNADNIIYWSDSLRQLQGITEGSAIKTKALAFLRKDLIKYDADSKLFLCLPIPNYNSTTYKINNRGDNHFECSCQFYNKVSKIWDHPTCSHIEAVKLYLEIRRWNNKSRENR